MCDEMDYPNEPCVEPAEPMFDNDLAFPELQLEEDIRDAQELQVTMAEQAETERALRKRGWR